MPDWQVFRNLVSNALKFAHPGTAVTVRTDWHPDRAMDSSAAVQQAAGLDFCGDLEPAGSVTVAVEDLGAGILHFYCNHHRYPNNGIIGSSRLCE
jgi:signal transduction histidine kinase